MLQPICNICKKIVKGDIRFSEHYCDRCAPFAAKYNEDLSKLSAELMNMMEKRIDQMRNEFLRDVVVPNTKPKLEVVK